MSCARHIRIRLAAAFYELALQVAPADVAATIREIVEDGRDILRFQLDLADPDRGAWPEMLSDNGV